MNFELKKATFDDKELLWNLLQFALYDGSFYVDNKIDENGLFEYSWYNYYFSRVFLEKLYNNEKMKLVLKGSYSQFIKLGNIYRPLTDIDIITFDKMEDAKDQIDQVINQNNDIRFKIINTFTTTNATLNYKILCDFDGKTGRISMDLKRDEILDFSDAKMPVLFSKDKTFDTQAISIEEHLASKLYVVLLHLKLYSVLSREFRRFKDFFDIHTILGTANIDEYKVMKILERKIRQDEFLRDYELDGPLFKKGFVENNQNSWNKDKKDLQFLSDTSFEDAVDLTNEFISRRR